MYLFINIYFFSSHLILNTHQLPIEAFTAALRMMKASILSEVCLDLPLLSQSYTYNVPCSINDYRSFILQVEDIDNDETACIIANLIYEVNINCYMKTEVL